jgi:hypothetical protein
VFPHNAGRAATRVYGLPAGFLEPLVVAASGAGHNTWAGPTKEQVNAPGRAG